MTLEPVRLVPRVAASSACHSFTIFAGSAGDACPCSALYRSEVIDVEIVHPRCAGTDVHKRQITVAVRTPGDRPGRRGQQIRRFATFFAALQQMTVWLVEQQVTQVAMESTGIYWRPVFHALTAAPQIEVILCNAAHVKNVPGRKTDASDAAWLAELCEVGLLRPSFIPPPDIAALRQLTRYRRKLIEEWVRETQRLHKVLEDAAIKLDSVASDSLGASGRAMIDALVAGRRDPHVLANLAKGVLRRKIPDLTLALAGRFTDSHALMCRLHLAHLDHLTQSIAELDERIRHAAQPYTKWIMLLQTIPGIGERTAQVVIAETGTDMTRFKTAAHLASWAGICPGNHESAGKRRKGSIRHGNPYLTCALAEAANAAGHTATRLGERYRRLRRRFGRKAGKKTAIAIGHTLLVIIWHLLTKDIAYTDLGADYYTRHDNPDKRKNRLVAQLEALGYTVQLTPTT